MSSLPRAFTAIIIVLWLLVVMPHCRLTAADELPTWDEIQRRWLAREERCATLDIRWSELEERHRSAKPEVEPDPFKAPVPGPTVKHSHSYHRRLVLDGVRIRLEDASPAHFRGEHRASSRISVDDGSQARELRSYLLSAEYDYQGDIVATGSAQKDLANWIDFQPVLYHYRPSWNLIKSLRDQKLSIDAGKHKEIPFIVLRYSKTSFGVEHGFSFRLDPSKELALVRFSHEVAGEMIDDHQMEYIHDEKLGVILSAWTMLGRSRRGGAIDRKIKAEVMKTRLNEAIDAKEFVLTFPPRTLVVDNLDILKKKKR